MTNTIEASENPIRTGRQITAARVLLDLPQKELAAAAGFTARTLRSWERARRTPATAPHNLARLVEIFRDHGVEFTASPIGVSLSRAA